MLELNPRNQQVSLDDGADLLTQAKTRMLTDEQISNLKCLVNNSVVGASKLLHLVAPDRYAIWDSKVFRFVHEQRSFGHRVNNVKNYRDYLDELAKIKKRAGFEGFHKSVEKKVGYPISDLRAIELVMFLNAPDIP